MGPVVATCMSLYCCGAAIAGLKHPGTWSAESSDGKYVFVMLSPLPIEEDIRYPEDEVEIRAIRSTYSKSGLYLHGHAEKPLWSYDGPWLSSTPIIAPDGEHLIFPGGWTGDEYAHDAVMFMRHGKPIRSYYDVEIIPQWRLKAMLNGWEPPTCDETFFDPKRMTYTIRTNQREEIVFDIKGGNIIDVQSPFPILYAIALAVLSAMLGLLVALWRRRRREARR